VLLLVPQVASAQAVTISQTFLNGAAGFTLFFIKIFNFLTWFTLSILDLVMNPRWIFQVNADGTDGPLLNMLHELWQFNRDLVNLGFAIALIVGAVRMIITSDSSKVKEGLKKYLLAIVLVNFSWFIPRVIFDFSQILTYTVYQIPSLLGADGCMLPATGDDAAPRPCEVVLSYRFLDQTNEIAADGTGPGGTTGWRCPLPGVVCVQTVPINEADASVSTQTKVLDGLVVNHARLQWLAQVDLTSTPVLPPGASIRETLTRLGGIVIKLFLVLIIHIALLFPLMAMVAAFFIRIPVLWVSMAFMPFVALGFAFESLKNGEGKALFWEWQDHFLKAAFLPAKVAIPFVIGFIMLNAGAQLAPPDGMGNIPLVPVFVGVRDMWQLMWMGIALFIIWHYSFEQLKGDKAGFMGHFTDKIKEFGGSLGTIATQLPLSMPFIPVPGRVDASGNAERMSLGQALRGIDPRMLARELSSRGKLDKDVFSRNAGLGGSRPGDVTIKVIQNNPEGLKTLVSELRADGLNQEGLTKVMEQFRKTYGSIAAMRGLNEQQVIDHIITAGGLTGDAALQKRIKELIESREGRGTTTVT
jgi:hypothetical protein